MRSRPVAALGSLLVLCSLVIGGATARASAPTRPASPVQAMTAGVQPGSEPIACAGGQGPLQHVIYLQFDNTHLLADRPGVPSDLEQMPSLLNFMRNNGTLSSNDHTILISHTGGGILSSITGVYPDNHGQAVSNSFRYYNPDGTSGLGVSFAYWTDGIFDPTNPDPTDPSYNMVTADGQNAPAPWVPFTRAGCDFGAVGTANTVLENINPDVAQVFGADSPEAEEAASDPNQALADFVGVDVHCAQDSAFCDSADGTRPDVLPQEPGGYDGFEAAYGAKYVDPVLSPSGPLTDLDGNVIADPQGDPGFPGFDGMSASVSLSWVAAMQEHGVPVTYAYISDAHDLHVANEETNGFDHVAQGPGEEGYVQQLRDYDRAFSTFFDRLAGDGITPENTLFVFTVEEGDHFVGGKPANPGCDGVNTPCEWAHEDCATACPSNEIGEINVNLRGLLATEQGDTTSFQVHSDMAPAFYLDGDPAPGDPVTRTFERDTAALTAVNPYTGTTEPITRKMIDRVGMELLHMITGDPLRTPTFVDFLDPDYFGYAGASDCSAPCSEAESAFAWNHGGIAPEIASTWVGFVGPGVKNLGQTDALWSDHTDFRPTILLLAGLSDDYAHDGRVLTEFLTPDALPGSLRMHAGTVNRLGEVYKKITAPFGQIGRAGIEISTTALEGDDATYNRLEAALSQLTGARNAVAGQMRDMLEAASFDGQAIDVDLAQQLIRQGQHLIQRALKLAGLRV